MRQTTTIIAQVGNYDEFWSIIKHYRKGSAGSMRTGNALFLSGSGCIKPPCVGRLYTNYRQQSSRTGRPYLNFPSVRTVSRRLPRRVFYTPGNENLTAGIYSRIKVMSVSKKPSYFHAALPWLTIAGMLLGWHLLTRSHIFPDYALPSPTAVFHALVDEARAGRLWHDITASLFRVSCGFALAVALGIPLGLWLGMRAAPPRRAAAAREFFPQSFAAGLDSVRDSLVSDWR